MKLPKRFSLAALLLLMLLVASVFGYAQWRKQWLIAEVKRLGEYTSRIEVSEDWFWPSVTPTAQIVLAQNSVGQMSDGDRTYRATEVKELYESVEKRLRAIGVNEVAYGVIITRAIPRDDIRVMISFVTIDELVEWYDL